MSNYWGRLIKNMKQNKFLVHLNFRPNSVKNMAKGCQNNQARKNFSCFVLCSLFPACAKFGRAKPQQVYFGSLINELN